MTPTPEDIAKLKRQLKEAKRVLREIVEVGKTFSPHQHMYDIWTVLVVERLARCGLERLKEIASGKR